MSVEQSIAEPRRNNAVTLDATVDLLERAREESARVVVASSAAIYGTPDTVPVGEAASKTPESPYGIAKLTVDQYARAYHDGGWRRSSSAISTCTGHDNPPATTAASSASSCDRPRTTIDYLGEAFNIGTSAETSVHDLAHRVRDVTGTTAEIVHTDERPGDVQRSRADITAARRELGFEPTVGLETGLETISGSN